MAKELLSSGPARDPRAEGMGRWVSGCWGYGSQMHRQGSEASGWAGPGRASILNHVLKNVMADAAGCIHPEASRSPLCLPRPWKEERREGGSNSERETMGQSCAAKG